MPAAVAIPLISAAVTAGGAVTSSALASRSAGRAAKLQTDAANRAGDLSASATDRALQFQREQESERQKEWQATQQRNYEIYQQEQAYQHQQDQQQLNLTLGQMAYTQGQRADTLNRVAPYRQAGVGSLRQLASPLPSMSQGGTLLEMARRPS